MSAPTLVPVADGVELCVQSFGSPGDPALLLLGGATSSMDWWEVDWCTRLASAGLRVIRYDHRDTGQSTSWPAGSPGYAAPDLSRDVVRLLDALGLPSAHLLGVSMGGGIAQDLAVSSSSRVLSLTLVATSCAFSRASSTPLPAPVDGLFDEVPEPDWSSPSDVAAHLVAGMRPYAGSLGLPPSVESIAAQVVARTRDVRASLTNHWAVVGSDDSPARSMSDIRVPTLVVHGSDDPMFPLPHGEALAEEIAGARLVVVQGMGHEVPPRPTWDQVVPEVLALVSPRRQPG
jgi:pimeloyl-ACP methyl ester carboxylesterase